MNRIQMISREVEIRRLKLQMGLDPDLDIPERKVRGMWRELSLEQERAAVRRQFQSSGIDDLPVNPAFPARD